MVTNILFSYERKYIASQERYYNPSAHFIKRFVEKTVESQLFRNIICKREVVISNQIIDSTFYFYTLPHSEAHSVDVFFPAVEIDFLVLCCRPNDRRKVRNAWSLWLNQGDLTRTVASTRYGAPAGNQTPATREADEHSTTELSVQLIVMVVANFTDVHIMKIRSKSCLNLSAFENSSSTSTMKF